MAALLGAPSTASAQTDPCAAARAIPVSGAVTPVEVCRVMSVLAHDSLEGRGTGTPGGSRAARFIAEEFRRAGLEPVGDSAGWFQRVPLDSGRVSVNVLGILCGTDPILKDSVVLVDAHYDHIGLTSAPIDVDSMQTRQVLAAPIRAELEAWLDTSGVAARADRGIRVSEAERAKLNEFYARVGAVRVDMDSLRRVHPIVRRDSVFNGADDDASGITVVIEAARQLAAGPRPKRTILFAAMTGEEIGLVGTEWYIAHPVVPNAALQANLEVEMIGRPDPLVGGAGRAWLTGFERSTMGAMLRDAGLPVVADPRPGQSFFARSDNFAFARMGIPAHTFSSFGLHSDYHQVTDDLAGIDFAHMTVLVNEALKAVELLANGPAPVWNPGGRP